MLILARNKFTYSEKGIMLSYHLPEIEIIGDPSLLNTVWDNLLSNDIKYNKPDGIEITIEEREELVIVTFVDTGIGMSEMELERIFERFYRADMARTRPIEGIGLGLSIVATIIKLHCGNITLNSKEKVGSTFIVELPFK
ncbi:sensor histidine kinase [Neobacillus ginsengisoli]|uniref:histidine kinase n=1 Tax=Neobacillus ginsengisoli TaxID=904295 RepID=A0ABT9Y0L9_9BACI|nr:HAMP domain-containing sensor histidine kinase [Neobacillus ginsengisoli]MDQ0201294.1 signal transduction histidine kinase [Neobacillus ginsengisoli]